MTIITQTPRLIIREFLPEELEVYLDHFNDEKILKHIPKRTREERTGIFNFAQGLYQQTKAHGIWGMFDAATGAFTGSCLLRPFDGNETIFELGYSLEQKCWNKGFATEMATAIINYGFTTPTVTEIVAVTTFDNIASQRVLEKAGMLREGNLKRGEDDLAFFSLKR